MWFKAINKEKFTQFTLLEAKLNYAYWCSVLIEHIEDSSEISTELEQRKRATRENMVSLINEVSAQIQTLDGTEGELLSHHLDYVTLVCSFHIERTKTPQKSNGPNTVERMTDEEKMEAEINFIKQRADLMPSEDLIAQWDRGIYLLYDFLKCALHENRDLIEVSLLKRLKAARDLMSPTIIEIHDYCHDYSTQLDIGWLDKLKVYGHYTRDCMALFSAGHALVIFCSDCRIVRENLVNASEDKQRAEWQYIQARQTVVQEDLIKTNLRKSRNIINAINPDKLSD